MSWSGDPGDEGPKGIATPSEKYDEEYFMNGLVSGRSNYFSYSWQPDLTMPMVNHAKRYLGIHHGDSLLDWGAARGYFVKGMRMIGVQAHGYDISTWAVENCDPQVKVYIHNTLSFLPKDIRDGYDFLWSKDVLEHIPLDELCMVLPRLLSITRKKSLFIVPLSAEKDGEYINPLDQKDETHIHRWTMKDWLVFLQKMSSDFVVSGSYRVPLLKASSELYPCSAAFITLSRF